MSDNNKNLGSSAVKAGLWYTVGNIAIKGCVFISLPIFTRLLSTSDFGIYNEYIAYEQIMTAVLGLGLYGTVKNAKLDFKRDFDKYLSSIMSLSLLFVIIILLVANVCYSFLSDFLGYSRFVVNCLILQSFGAYLLYFYGTKLNVEFKYKSYLGLSFFNISGNIVISILLILYVFPNERYLARILGTAVPLIFIAVAVCCVLWIQGRTAYSKKYWKYALAIGLPLIPHVISQSLLSQFDRIMISDLIGADEAGIYSYIYTLCTILYIVGNSFENAWTPWVFLTLNEGKEDVVNEASKEYISFFSLLTVGFMCVMPEITRIMVGSQYWSGISLIVPLTIGNYFIFLYTLPVNIEYYNKKTVYISIGTVGAAGLNIFLNYFAINMWGYQAAAYTTLLSYALLFIFHWNIAKKYNCNRVYPLRHCIINASSIICVGIVLLFTEKHSLIYLLIRYVGIIIILGLIIKKRSIIINALRRKGE